MTEWHRAFSLSIPIPIPIATPTPIALRRCLDSVVSVIREPLLSDLRQQVLELPQVPFRSRPTATTWGMAWAMAEIMASSGLRWSKIAGLERNRSIVFRAWFH
jgi:hypothetical protein